MHWGGGKNKQGGRAKVQNTEQRWEPWELWPGYTSLGVVAGSGDRHAPPERMCGKGISVISSHFMQCASCAGWKSLQMLPCLLPQFQQGYSWVFLLFVQTFQKQFPHTLLLSPLPAFNYSQCQKIPSGIRRISQARGQSSLVLCLGVYPVIASFPFMRVYRLPTERTF